MLIDFKDAEVSLHCISEAAFLASRVRSSLSASVEVKICKSGSREGVCGADLLCSLELSYSFLCHSEVS